MRTKRELAGEVVAKHGRYNQGAGTESCTYYCRLGSRATFAADTAELADKVAAKYTRAELEEFISK